MTILELMEKYGITSSRITMDEIKEFNAVKFKEPEMRSIGQTRTEIPLSHYTTKKEIKEEIKWVNDWISEIILENKQGKGYRPWNNRWIEKLIDRENKLKNKLKYMQIAPDSTHIERLKLAQAVPLSNFLEFNRAGKTKCIYHNEKDGSLHYYKKSNKAYCFSCRKMVDGIEIIKVQQNLSFIDSINYILGK